MYLAKEDSNIILLMALRRVDYCMIGRNESDDKYKIWSNQG